MKVSTSELYSTQLGETSVHSLRS